MSEPYIGNMAIHGATRVRVVMDHEHRCVDIKIEGTEGARATTMSITVFGADESMPGVAVLTPEEDAAEVSAAYRRRLDAAGEVLEIMRP